MNKQEIHCNTTVLGDTVLLCIPRENVILLLSMALLQETNPGASRPPGWQTSACTSAGNAARAQFFCRACSPLQRSY